MGVDQTSLDRIRNATFPASRRGYDKHEVEKFLARLADWLETGGGDESRSDTVKRELERVGQRTGAILAQAEESAQQIRAEAEEEVQETITKANAQAEQTRGEADEYSSQTRGSADSYAEQTRQSAEQDATEARDKAEADARQTIESAQAQARRIVDEGTQRREDIEAVIADLTTRRDEVLTDTESLAAKLTGAVSDHRSAQGADPFEKPEELDPLEREGAIEDEVDDEVEDQEPEAESDELEAEPDEQPAGEEDVDEGEPEDENPKARRPRRRGKRGRVQA
jgi:DivIVA domain-containing protein